MISNKLDPIVTGLFIWDRKLKVSLVFFTQFYFAVPEDIRLNCTHYFVLKIPNKQELKPTASQNSPDIDFIIDFIDFINLYTKCTEKTFLFSYW